MTKYWKDNRYYIDDSFWGAVITRSVDDRYMALFMTSDYRSISRLRSSEESAKRFVEEAVAVGEPYDWWDKLIGPLSICILERYSGLYHKKPTVRGI